MSSQQAGTSSQANEQYVSMSLKDPNKHAVYMSKEKELTDRCVK
jgi:hypothetical protein